MSRNNGGGNPPSLQGFRKGLDKIHILAKGPTWFRCPQKVPDTEEIWGINATYNQNPADRLFIMHDIRHHFQIEDHEASDKLNALDIPIYSPVSYPFLDRSEQFPIKDVVEYHQTTWFANVICYMMALAIMLEPKEIGLYGVEMVGLEYELERPAVLFWCGVAHGHGIKVEVPPESKLFDPKPPLQLVYGYRAKELPNGLINLVPNLEHGKRVAQKYEWVAVGEEFEVDDHPHEVFLESRRKEFDGV